MIRGIAGSKSPASGRVEAALALPAHAWLGCLEKRGVKGDISMGPKPPETLRKQGKTLWRFVTSNFFPEAHHLAVLRVACEALDRYAACRARLDREGLTYKDRFGKPKAHPLLAPERDARGQFITALTALGLDESDLPQRMAPPRAGGLRVLPGQKGR